MNNIRRNFLPLNPKNSSSFSAGPDRYRWPWKYKFYGISSIGIIGPSTRKICVFFGLKKVMDEEKNQPSGPIDYDYIPIILFFPLSAFIYADSRIDSILPSAEAITIRTGSEAFRRHSSSEDSIVVV
jgi:hypothetical protein